MIDPTLNPQDEPSPFDTEAVARARNLLDAVPDTIGRYRILERIGGGGMGEVFVAEQTAPIKRRVAIKVIKAGMDTRQVVARFEAERQALAMMDHPNIAKVFDAGTTDTGRPYFVMELVRGVPVTQFCDEAKLTTRQRIELLVPICQAVQHAHQKGIIHRDLKPTNVLVTLHDGKPVPKVIDFGIAKATSQPLTDKTVYTEFRQMIGTPAYMSPEQAEMSGLDIDTRSDIYSLGVLMYELLTGTTPFETSRLVQAGIAEIQRIIKEEEPPRPSLRISSLGQTLPSIAAQRGIEPARLGKIVAGELDWIVMKALEKDRKRRYETANDLAADLNRHLDGEPIVAAPPSAAYRARKFVRKHRAAVVSATVVTTLLSVGFVGTSWQWRRAQANAATATRNLSVAERERAESERHRDVAEGEAYIANLALGQAAMQADHWPEARKRLDSCPISKRGWEWRFLRKQADTIEYAFHQEGLAGVVSPDGVWLFTRERGRFWMTNLSDNVSYWNRLLPEDVNNARLAGQQWIQQATFRADSSLLVVCTISTAFIFDRKGEPVGAPMAHELPIRAVRFEADGNRIVTETSDARTYQWDLSGKPLGKTAAPKAAPEHATNSTEDIVWSVDHRQSIVDTENTGMMTLQDAHGRVLGYSVAPAMRWFVDPVFLPDNKRVIVGSGVLTDDVSRIYPQVRALVNLDRFDSPQDYFEDEIELEIKHALGARPANPGPTYSMNSMPGGEMQVLRDGAQVALLTDGIMGRHNFAVSPDGSRLLTSGADRSIRFWDTKNWREVTAISARETILYMRFTPDGTRLIVNYMDGNMEIWDTRDYTERQRDRDARFNEVPPARDYIQQLLASDVPAEGLQDFVRNDKSISALRKLVILEQLILQLKRLGKM